MFSSKIRFKMQNPWKLVIADFHLHQTKNILLLVLVVVVVGFVDAIAFVDICTIIPQHRQYSLQRIERKESSEFRWK